MISMSRKYEPIIGVWVKSKAKHIKTFINNWKETKEIQAFCVYDLPPILPEGGVVFLHATRLGKLVAYARYAGYEEIKGWPEYYEAWRRQLGKGRRKREPSNADVWMNERERVWRIYGPKRLHTHDKEEFNNFWASQAGVRGLFLMKDIQEVPRPVPWGDEVRILKIHGLPGISYRYLTLSQVLKFLELSGLKVRVRVKGISSPKVILEYS